MTNLPSSKVFLFLLAFALLIIPSGFAALNDGSIEAHYNLSNTADSSINGRTLTNNGAVSFVPGIIGNGASNFSSANVLNRTGEAWMNCVQTSNNCTVNMWFNLTSTPTFEALFGHSTNPDTGGQSFLTVDGGTGTLVYYQFNGGGYDTATGTTTINQNQWYMVTLRFTNATMSMYVNGVNESSVALPGAPFTAPLSIGFDQHQGEFSGVIDEWTVWNRTLTPTEITTLYNAGAGLAFPFDAAPPANSPPVLQTSTVALTTNNQTLILTANATDTDNSSILYEYLIQRNGVNITNGQSGPFTQGVSTNFVNYSISSVPGNYTALVQANDGLNVSNIIVTNTVEATFPGPPVNNPPVLQAASLAITADNQTLIITGNATDTDNSSIIFNYVVQRNGVNISSANSASFPQGVSVNFANVSTGSVNGNYTVLVTANDGVNNSNTILTNSVTATFASPVTPSQDSLIDGLIGFVIMVGLLIALLIAAERFFPDRQQLIFLIIICLLVIIGLATLIVLL